MWINRNTVTTESWSGIEGHKTKRLCGGRLYNFPRINSQMSTDNRSFIGQSYINGSKGIFKQFDHFSSPSGTHGNNIFNKRLIKQLSHLSAIRGDASNYFWGVMKFVIFVAWINPLGRKGQVKVLANL